jgi:hypothetical protein
LIDVIAPLTSPARSFASASMSRISRPLASRMGDADVECLFCG